ncbi:hypothetical protein BJ875DRAFT_443206 [Amylocarpus encephaloides]|uniref:2EXR domain-containing protein n=1 Tax=Amylocarpus encephaloides TaxID=45428 RepID=A0A9P7YFD1_9HELO|nr:hypothetical protein BJ875DRAFT_443206 [Amylocarpus encephaloides]
MPSEQESMMVIANKSNNQKIHIRILIGKNTFSKTKQGLWNQLKQGLLLSLSIFSIYSPQPLRSISPRIFPTLEQSYVMLALPNDIQIMTETGLQHSGAMPIAEKAPLGEFKYFSILPSEIRLVVWKFAMPQPRRIVLGPHGTKKQLDSYALPRALNRYSYRLLLEMKSDQHPVTLQINKESRIETLKRYRLADIKVPWLVADNRLGYTLYRPNLRSNWMCFDPFLDIFIVGIVSYDWYARVMTRNPGCFDSIRHIEIDCTALNQLPGDGSAGMSGWSSSTRSFLWPLAIFKNIQRITLANWPTPSVTVLPLHISSFHAALRLVYPERPLLKIFQLTEHGELRLNNDEEVAEFQQRVGHHIMDHVEKVLQNLRARVESGIHVMPEVKWKDSKMGIQEM